MSWWVLIGYLALQLVLGAWVSRRITSESDFFVAGKRLGGPLIALSLFATWFGAETCLGAAGAVYESGLSGARADPFGYAMCLFLMGAFLAARLWRGGHMTLGDLFRSRFGPHVERLGVLVLVPSSLIWAAAQVRAFGQVVSQTMSVDVTLSVYLAAAFVIVYTFLGGLLGDVITDVVQGALMIVCLFIMLFAGISELGGIEASWTRISPSQLTLFPPGEGILGQLDRFSVPILGSLVAQELIARVLAARSEGVARSASFWAGGIYLAVGLSPVLLGLLGPSLLPGLEDPEQLLPSLAQHLLPSFLYAAFSCALVAAILSTVDSILLASSALLAHNGLVPLLRIESERTKLAVARLLVVLSGATALVVALHTESIYDLVETASAFGTAGVLIVTLAALYSPWGGPKSATAALLVGLLTTPVAEYVLDWPAPFITSVLAALFAYAAISLLETSRESDTRPA